MKQPLRSIIILTICVLSSFEAVAQNRIELHVTTEDGRKVVADVYLKKAKEEDDEWLTETDSDGDVEFDYTCGLGKRFRVSAKNSQRYYYGAAKCKTGEQNIELKSKKNYTTLAVNLIRLKGKNEYADIALVSNDLHARVALMDQDVLAYSETQFMPALVADIKKDPNIPQYFIDKVDQSYSDWQQDSVVNKSIALFLLKHQTYTAYGKAVSVTDDVVFQKGAETVIIGQELGAEIWTSQNPGKVHGFDTYENINLKLSTLQKVAGKRIGYYYQLRLK